VAGVDLVELSRFVENRLGTPPLIRLNGKAPLDDGWPFSPWSEPDPWRERLVHHDGNVGVPLGCVQGSRDRGGLLVLDLDIYKPGAEIAWEAAVDLGWTEDTVRARTGGGGVHVWFCYDPLEWAVKCRDMAGRQIPGTDGSVWPKGFEIKAEGGQVVLPPSVHPETNQAYEWEDGAGPDDIKVREAPDSLLRAIGIPIGSNGPTPRLGPSQSWSRYDPELVHPATAEATRLLMEHFGGHDPVIVYTGLAEPYVQITRPGKQPQDGSSATIGYTAPSLVKVFTDGWTSAEFNGPEGWDGFAQNEVCDVSRLRRIAHLEQPDRVNVKPLEPGTPIGPQLPPGLRLFTPGDTTSTPVPVLGPDAYHGPIGDYLHLLEGNTEAHPAAIASQLFVELGVMAGRAPVLKIDDSITQHLGLFVAIVGPSLTGAKGTAEGVAHRLVDQVDPGFRRKHNLTGTASGEDVIYALRDPKDGDTDVVPTRFIADAELSTMFRAAARDGSILSQTLRKAFDLDPLRHSSRGAGETIASKYLLGIAGAITPHELLSTITELDIANGFANRFLLLWSEAVDVLPFGGISIDAGEVAKIAKRIEIAITTAQDNIGDFGQAVYTFADDARDEWDHWYRDCKKRFSEADDRDPGVLITARSIVHTARLALFFTVFDGEDEVGAEHITAAKEWVRYSAGTAARIFDGAEAGDRGRLLKALRAAGVDGLSRTDITNLFGRNRTAEELDQLIEVAGARGQLAAAQFTTGGRPVTRLYATTKDTK